MNAREVGMAASVATPGWKDANVDWTAETAVARKDVADGPKAD